MAEAARAALVVAADEFVDPRFQRLRSPTEDVDALAGALALGAVDADELRGAREVGGGGDGGGHGASIQQEILLRQGARGGGCWPVGSAGAISRAWPSC